MTWRQPTPTGPRWGARGQRIGRALVRDHEVQLENTYTGETEAVPAQWLVDVTFGVPNDPLWRDHPNLWRAGDAVAPRTAY